MDERKAGSSILNRSVLWLILVSSTLTVMAGAILGPVVRNIRLGLGVDPSAAGLIITMHGLFVFLLSPLAGSLIDRIGSKRPYVFGLLLYGIAGGSGMFLGSYPLLLISRAFLGVAVALVFTAVTVMILRFYKGRDKDRVMGYRGSANNLGAAIWPLVGGALGTISWHMPFGVYLIAVPIGLLALAFVPDIEHVAAKREGSVLAVFRENTVLFGIYAFMLLTNLLLYAIVVYLPEIIKGAGITNTFQVGLFFAGMGIAGGLSATQYGRVRERASYSRIVSLVFLLWSVGFALAYFWHSVWAFVLLVVLFGTGQGLALPAVMLWVGDVVRPSFHGRFSSYITTTGYLGQFLSPIAFAPVVSRLGVGHVYLAALFVGLGGLAFSLVFVKKGTGSREISSEGP